MNIFRMNRETLWIIRLEIFLSKIFRSRFVASLSIFYIPIMISGYVLQIYYNYEIFSKGILIALSWVAIAPFLIENAFRQINDFFCMHRHIFKNNEESKKIRSTELKRFQSSKYLVFGLPWGILTSTIILYSIFDKAPLLIKFWSIISFFILFFISSIGLYGSYALVKMIENILMADIIFDPFHPDKLGGISCFAKFSVKIAIYISSGALVYPLAFDVMTNINDSSGFLSVVTYLLVAFYTFIIFASFLIPILQIKKFVGNNKERLMLESSDKLNNMSYEFKKDKDVKYGIEILLYYFINHSRLKELKDSPLDIDIITTFGLSFVIPIIVATLQLFF